MQNQSSFDFVKITFPPLLLPWFRVFQIPWRITRFYLKNWHFFKGNWSPEPTFSNKIENHNSQSCKLQHAYMRSQQLFNKTRFVTIGWTCLRNSIEKIGIFQLLCNSTLVSPHGNEFRFALSIFLTQFFSFEKSFGAKLVFYVIKILLDVCASHT
jgi:hypothetical protein